MLRIAIPLALAELGWMSMGVVDTIMVGRLPASVGNALFYAFAIFCLGLMSSNKVSSIGSNPTAFSRSRIDVAHALSVPCRDSSRHQFFRTAPGAGYIWAAHSITGGKGLLSQEMD